MIYCRTAYRILLALIAIQGTIVPASYAQSASPGSTLIQGQRTARLQEANQLDAELEKLYGQGRYAEAIQLADKVLALRESVLGLEHPDVATSLNNLALLYNAQGLYEKAEPLFKRALAINEKALGSEHLDVALSLNNLAGLYNAQGLYEKAEPLYKRALAINEKALGSDHPSVAANLNNLASLYYAQGLYEKAEPLYKRALAINEKALGSEHPNVALSLNNLALLYNAQGLYEKAEPLYKRALAINEKALGSEHPNVALSLNNLAELYRTQGRYEKAEPLYKRALAINEKALGSDHPSVAANLNNLAELYRTQGRYEKAESLYKRALAINEKTLGSDHPSVAAILNNLAALYNAQGLYKKREPLLQRALAINEKALSSEHPNVATSLNNLAELYRTQGRYEKAEPLYKRALAINEKALGSGHPDVATSLSNLALLYWAKGDRPAALDLLSRSLSVDEAFLSGELIVGSEERKRSLLTTRQGTWESIVSFNQQVVPQNPAAIRLALTAILQRKGRTLDALASNLATLRQNLTPADQKLFDKLTDIRSQLSNLYFSGLGKQTPTEYRRAIDTLKQQDEQLETDLTSRSALFRSQQQPISLEAVQKLLPTDAVLVELVRYQPFDPKAKPGRAWGATRYAAYLLRATGDPSTVDLGEADAIDTLVAHFRDVVNNPNSDMASVRTLSQKLYKALITPFKQSLGQAKRLLVSPDGVLNLLPFAALVGDDNQYLAQSYALSYLTSGRDLLRLSVVLPSQSGPLVIANPDFAASPGLQSTGAERQSAGLGTLNFRPLPGTAAEAKAITPLLTSPKVLTGQAATVAALKSARAPQILHIATHGFFLQDQPESSPDSIRRGAGVIYKYGENAPTKLIVDSGENPLLRSGLALAGANRKDANGKGGLLSALEVASLNLLGTQLVVLSACETGVGSVINGEGVYGLRRALLLAGVRTEILSLWKVSDLGTQTLMIGFYSKLQKGIGKEAALRSEQLRFIKSEKYAHPYYWAAFILDGDWR
jgi:CHAT domain-containing protein/Tfp pilus assembly protein PilF